VALITGGAVRVGRAISLGLARAGYDLVITYHSSSAQAKTLSADVSALGRTLVCVAADLGEAHAADHVIDTVRNSFGRLDVLVNSAASFQDVPLLDVDADEWDRVMDLNVPRSPPHPYEPGADMLRDSRGLCRPTFTDPFGNGQAVGVALSATHAGSS
jgi:Dehydrogenases with different specificities (related to short-chain alcohol dehydrogenases)